MLFRSAEGVMGLAKHCFCNSVTSAVRVIAEHIRLQLLYESRKLQVLDLNYLLRNWELLIQMEAEFSLNNILDLRQNSLILYHKIRNFLLNKYSNIISESSGII